MDNIEEDTLEYINQGWWLYSDDESFCKREAMEN